MQTQPLGGFLWCLWAVYKASLGDEFGEYTIIMYRYAKRYYKKLMKELPQLLLKRPMIWEHTQMHFKTGFRKL